MVVHELAINTSSQYDVIQDQNNHHYLYPFVVFLPECKEYVFNLFDRSQRVLIGVVYGTHFIFFVCAELLDQVQISLFYHLGCCLEAHILEADSLYDFHDILKKTYQKHRYGQMLKYRV